MAAAAAASSDRRSKEIKAELATSILGMIKECEEEQNVDRKIEILYQINSIMPESERLEIPSLITNDFVDVALSRIEEKVLCWHFEKEVSGDDNGKYAVTS
jgi:hypothetical protein